MAGHKGSGDSGGPEPEFLEVARVLRPWGVRGDVKVALLSSHPTDLAAGRTVYVGGAHRACVIQRAQVRGDTAILGLNGYETPEQAEELRDQPIFIGRGAATPLAENEYYHHQILGLAVVTDTGQDLGRIVDILETGANDVYIVQGPRGEVLIPARIEVVQAVDLAEGVMRVSLLPGLLPDHD